MVLQHNTNAMNVNRQLGLTTRRLTKISERLTSGYKINRAADDAAGLSISEKMRKQIRGLNQASDNIEDGFSLCLIADVALNETVDILQRMRELAVQSANGTNSASDRQAIEREIIQLKSEVDRIAETTKFNDAVYPLNRPVMYGYTVTETIEVPDQLPGYHPNNGLIRETTTTFRSNHQCTYDGKVYNVGDTITLSGLTTNDTEIWIHGGSAYIGDNWGSGNNVSWDVLGPLKKSDLKIDANGYLYYLDHSGTEQYAVYMFTTSPHYPGSLGNPDPIHFTNKTHASQQVGKKEGRFMTIADLDSVNTSKPKPTPIIRTNTTYCFSNDSISVHAGASSSQNNKIPVPIVNATCRGLGINDLTVSTIEFSEQALVMLSDAISRASSYRSEFGAVQNRLEHAQKIDDNTAENTQAAESQIRDTSMADEMVRYSNTNILIQAGQAMLAQANQSKQGILNLVA